jgi:hypothetical protein
LRRGRMWLAEICEADPRVELKTLLKFHEAPHTWVQLYDCNCTIRVFNTILCENEFQSPEIFQQCRPLVFFPSNQL